MSRCHSAFFCAVTGSVLIFIVYFVTYNHSASTDVVEWPILVPTNSMAFSDQRKQETAAPPRQIERSQQTPEKSHEVMEVSETHESQASSNVPVSLQVSERSDEAKAPFKEEQGTNRIVLDKTSTVTKPAFTTFLLIMVPILPKSFHSREIIRDTWYKGFRGSKDVMLRFVMGTAGLNDINVTNKLATENGNHGDLIYFDNLAESRTALTNKTLLLMQWAYSNVEFSYLLKCDDDTFVFVEKMINELRKRPLTTRLYYGLIRYNDPPKTSGVWADTTWKLGKTYMPFAVGGGYILSSDLIKLIVGNIDYLEWHPNEDTAVGAWLVPYKIELRTDKLLCMSTYSWKPADCQKDIIMHLFYGIQRNKLDEIFYNCTIGC